MCHDYKAPGRDEYRWETTVAEERRNVHLAACLTEDEFVAMREARDATLSTPKLLLPSIQVNIRAGRLPPAEGNGISTCVFRCASKTARISPECASGLIHRLMHRRVRTP